MSKTIKLLEDNPANALALNKDYSRVIIGGKNVFKIFSIEENEFTEVVNLKVRKSPTFNFACNDVTWNTIDDHILATGGTNGAVVIWNLNLASKNKQEHVFYEHNRSVNRVSFNYFDANLLISGSQDGTLKVYDLRIGETVNKFNCNTESVRDVQFSPHSPVKLASVSENGCVQLWDLRKTDRYALQLTAHNGPIFACDWHPEKPFLATASRDRTIKVWDFSEKPKAEHIINTSTPIGRVKWRPQNKFQLASVGTISNDSTVNVWDLRRPYVSYATFNFQKDVPTGIAWRGDPYLILSTGKDSVFHQLSLDDAEYPALQCNPLGLSISVKGNIAIAYQTTQRQFKRDKNIPWSIPSSEEFCKANSNLKTLSTSLNKEIEFLVKCADEYILSGKSFADICDHNAKVARNAKRLAVSLLWKTIKSIFTPQLDHGYQALFKVDQDVVDAVGVKADESKKTDEDVRHLGDSIGDFFFGDAEMDPLSMDFEINVLDGLITEDWTLPIEAFPVRDLNNLLNRSTPPDQFVTPDSPDPVEEMMNGLNLEDPLSLKGIDSITPIYWDHGKPIADALRDHAENGDVQTPVCILTALGEKRNDLASHFDPYELEIWSLAYLDLLSQQEMWIHSNEIIKLSWLPNVSYLNQQSTTIYSGCNYCKKILPLGRSLCSTCYEPIICSFCHQVVHGLYAWCQGCKHGGHLNHMKEWIEKKKVCPTGCGHYCQYD